MVDFNATLGEQLVQIPIGESIEQVPALSDHDSLTPRPET